ncbi:hypothetical protein GCM10022240_30050 [Microbacterium kribbense]|uniref:N6 adenine-specific DNA methyltransferase N-terminal domain-containing protein n=1 Tax=Microbacterium kribbense TaxID=433645 RepID=A0ABP7H069_9MICO
MSLAARGLSNNHATFIWSIADLPHGSFKAHQYGDIILRFTVLRRLDAVLAPTKQAVFAVGRAGRNRRHPSAPVAAAPQGRPRLLVQE